MHLTQKSVILIPGFAGSKLVDTCPIPPPKLPLRTKGNMKQPSMNTRNNDFVNLSLFDKEWKEKFSLKYDQTSGLSMDDTIDVHDFGGVDGVRNLCSDCDRIDSWFNYFFKTEVINKLYNYKYFDTLINRLETKGYTPSIDLFGAPYDFRKIMIKEYLEDYFKRIKELVERSYEINMKKSVLVSHSIGCLITYIFLVEYCDPLWKAKYIDKFISVGGPYGGSSIALKTLLSGLPKLNMLKDKYYNVIQNSSGLVLALPNILGYDCNDLLVYNAETSECFYKHNYLDLLPDIPYHIWVNNVRQYIPTFIKNTGVKTVIATSIDFETEVSYYYDSIDFKNIKEPDTVKSSPGDSVIPAKSLLFHEQRRNWYPNYSFVDIRNNDHTQLLHSKELFELIVDD